MRITAPTLAFAEAAGHAAAVAASKSPKRVLECVAIRADRGEGLHLEATDLDVALRIRVPAAEVAEEGTAVVPAARFLAVLREVQEKDVTVRGTDRAGIEIESQGCRFQILGEDPHEFPVLPAFPTTTALRLPSGILRGMIRRTAFATAREAGRYALHGVLFRVAQGTLDLVATDGRRLARATHRLAEAPPSELKAIVGGKCLSLLDRIVSDEAASVEVALEERQILFRVGDLLLAARLIDGVFPSYEEVIPKPSGRGFDLPVGDLAQALRRASLLTTREAQSVQMEVAPKRLTISSRANEVGEAKVDVSVPYEDAPERLGFMPNLLLDALKVMDPARPVRFEFSTPKAPGRLTDGDDYVYVVMPVSVE
jgi:DNA polymerase-3 subunit beta